MKIWLLLLVALAMLVPMLVVASSHDLDDYDYAMTVHVSNASGSALSNSPVPVPMNPAALIADSFMQADAEDWRPVDTSESALNGVAQDMGSSSVSWWIDVSYQADGLQQLYVLHTGNATATRDQSFRFSGKDNISVPDVASLDFTTNYWLSALVTPLGIPAGVVNVIGKRGAYSIGTRDSNTLFARIHVGTAVDYSDSTTAALSPCSVTAGAPVLDTTGAILEGVNTAFGNALNCGSDAVVDDLFQGGGSVELYIDVAAGGVCIGCPIIAKGTTGVSGWAVTTDTTGCGANSEYLRFQVNYATTDGDWRTTACQLTESAGWQRVSLVFDADTPATPPVIYIGGSSVAVTTTQAPVGAYVSDAAQSIIFGGSAAGDDWDDARLWDTARSAAQILANYNVGLTGAEPGLAAYWKFDMLEAEVTYSPITVGTTYVAVVVYDGTDLTLTVDGVLQDTQAVAGSIPNSAEPLVLGAVYNGYLDNVLLGNPYVLNFGFDPPELVETQKGKASNAWTWLGTVADLVGSNDGTYTLVRDMTGITVWVGGLVSKDVGTIPAASTGQDLLGVTSANPAATQVGVGFLFRPYLEGVLDNPNLAVAAIAAWFLLFASVGVGLSAMMWRGTRSVILTVLPIPAMLWLGWALGTPIALWMPVLMTLASLGAAFGLRQMEVG